MNKQTFLVIRRMLDAPRLRLFQSRLLLSSPIASVSRRTHSFRLLLLLLHVDGLLTLKFRVREVTSRRRRRTRSHTLAKAQQIASH